MLTECPRLQVPRELKVPVRIAIASNQIGECQRPSVYTSLKIKDKNENSSFNNL